jgi:hypothetical protein
MSAMGDRLLLLEDTADALDVIHPELANQFRLVNGLPVMGVGSGSSAPTVAGGSTGPDVHVAAIDEFPDTIRVSCSCGRWESEVAWDRIDDLVTSARRHFGTIEGSVLEDGAGDDVGSDADPLARARRIS